MTVTGTAAPPVMTGSGNGERTGRRADGAGDEVTSGVLLGCEAPRPECVRSTRRARPALDTEVPALVVKVGSYPQHHGGLGVIRTLGRVGVSVYAMTERGLTPAAASRYLAGRFGYRSDRTGEEELLARLLEIGREIGRPTVAVPTDDEAGVLLAEHAAELSEYFLLPPVAPSLPRRLASKGELSRICAEHGIPAPRCGVPRCVDELHALVAELGYPLVLKNLESFTRLRRPVVGATAVVRDEAELLAHCPPGAWDRDTAPSVLVQEYLPSEHAQDWVTHLCCGPGGEPLVVFTGLKLRSWPPGAGVTTRARALPDPGLAELAVRLCRAIGYCGVADLDWRLDLRTGRYNLLDFNPRTGAQFRLFETADGVDVVRALHLSLTGRAVPAGPQLLRSYGVGQLDAVSAGAWAWRHRALPRDLAPRRSTERAWLCRDDPVPAAVELGWFGTTVADRLRRAVHRRG
ncbi:ATP-grasp domain-containing protein [Kitasatospora cinereorecta]|uniref:ATP-grasp domain-containing protein n=1 Tax=Kitasatospora cinereorecta TaxID=285560 RepID=A0ABW0VMY9_9ACTN